MKYLLILFITLNLYASSIKEIYRLYEKQDYRQACLIGTKNLYKNKKDEDYLSLYAFSCLKSGYIDRLSTPIALLKSSKEARSNSAYFSVILMQKKLLYHSLVDGYSLKELNLPTTDYILSKVFDLYIKNSNNIQKKSYIFKDIKDPTLSYKLYLFQDRRITKMIIEEVRNNLTIKKHIYW